jgi:transposase-like protein
MTKRRRFPPAFQAQVVLEVLTGVPSPAAACRTQALSTHLLATSKAAVRENQQGARGRTKSEGRGRAPEANAQGGVAAAWRQWGRFLADVSNRKRIHWALGSLTPSEFEEQWTSMQRSQ